MKDLIQIPQRAIYLAGMSLTILATVFAATSCSKHNEGKKSTNDNIKTHISSNEQIVSVYAAGTAEQLKPLLIEYSNTTGAVIELIDTDSDTIIDKIEAQGAKVAADVLITNDGSVLSSAAKKGIIQQINSPVLESNIREKYRDTENRWIGLSMRAHTIFYNPEKVKAADLSTYEDLATPKWKKKLCLTSSKNIGNKSLVAAMINQFGVNRAKFAVRGWKRNLATEVFEEDISLLKAVADGRCAVGIADTVSYGKLLDRAKSRGQDLNIKMHWTNQDQRGVQVNITGAGVLTNAENPLGALRLMEWLSSKESQVLNATINYQYPVTIHAVKSKTFTDWGRFKVDYLSLEQFSKLEGDATKIIKDVEYQ